VWVWLATSIGGRVHAQVCRADTGAPLGSGTGRAVRLGPWLWVHLAGVRPSEGRFPTDTLLAYDLWLDHDGRRWRLADLDLVGGVSSITYGEAELPTFFLPGGGSALNLLHGSCRLLHGHGEDAFIAADQRLAATALDPAERPSVLLLTGDQIYGDEVAGPLIQHLTRLGSELLGGQDQRSIPGLGPLGSVPAYGRQGLAERAGFTSSHAENHLFSLGEFCAAYLVAWNEGNWPDAWPAVEQAVPAGEGRDGRALARQRRRYAGELRELASARRVLPSVRRVLANVPTYMCFDDHDVTDDWNLTREWRDGVWRSPAGRRVVANALAAFWAFQGWGNQPEGFEELIPVVAGGPPTAGPAADPTGPAAGEAPAEEAPPAEFERRLWSYDRWSFTVPTSPPTVVLDTRTRRAYDGGRSAAQLLDRSERDRVKQLCRKAGVPPGGPLILVSPVPVFGLELQERRQKYLAGKLGPYAIDFEAWHSNLRGLVEFMRLLAVELELRRVVVLSGDVHYGLNVRADFRVDDAEVDVVQLVSSSFRHGGQLAKRFLHLVGRLARSRHERVGWDHPPQLAAPDRLARGLLRRAVNTDEWREDAPVFLPPTVAERTRPGEPPRYREVREYVAPVERPGWPLVGDNNVGAVRVHGGRVTHRLLAPADPRRIRTYTATFDFTGSRGAAEDPGDRGRPRTPYLDRPDATGSTWP
jgi:hypothetical protein